MDEYVACVNIEHFPKFLAKERDEAKRKTLLNLLAEEENKLAAIKSASKSEKTKQKP